MTKKVRRIIFYSLILIFILAGTLITFYAQGWRFDLKTLKTEKVGAIYIRSFPEGANYYLNGKPVKKDFGLIFNVGTFINGLFPATYNLDVTMQHYLPIHRTITVEPALVTTAQYMVLIPEDSKLLSDGPLSDFWLLGDEVLSKNSKGVINWRNKPISGSSVINWTDDFSKLLTSDKKNNYFWTDLSNGTSVNITASLKKLGYQPREVYLDKQNTSNILASFGSMVASYDPILGQISPIAASSTPTNMSASPFWYSWSNYDKKTNLSLITIANRSNGIIREPALKFDGKTVKMYWSKDNRLAVLQDDGSLYLYSSDLNSAPRLANDATDFVFTDDASEVAVLERSAIEVFSFKKDVIPNYWRFGIPNAQDIKNISWFRDLHHLFLSFNDSVSFLDLDDKNQESVIKITDTSKSIYDLRANGLFFIKNGKLYSFDLPG